MAQNRKLHKSGEKKLPSTKLRAKTIKNNLYKLYFSGLWNFRIITLSANYNGK